MGSLCWSCSQNASWNWRLEFRDRSDLHEIWRVSLQIPYFCFRGLSILVVDGCQFLLDVLPFSLLPLLPRLETLEVRNCDSMKTIFDVKCTTQATLITFPPLRKLVLSQLPNLETVWNEDPSEIPCTQHLEEVYVDNCKCLTSVFPTSAVKYLERLENLVIKHCDVFTEIVAETNPADPKGTTLNLTFPCVTSLTLWDLPKLKHTSLYCIHDATPTFEPITPNLQHLRVGENEMKMIVGGAYHGNHLHKLKVLTVCFHIAPGVFLEFLQLVPNVEKLALYSGSLKEIFCLQIPNNLDYTGFLLQLKELNLVSLRELVSIGFQNSWTEPFVRNLEIFAVINCSSLNNLVACTVSFSNLTTLEVKGCNSLLNLFTSSTAKSLAQLITMEISKCKLMEEIVSKEGEESCKDEEIIFEQLQFLYLKSLKELKCFYPGNFTLSFPSLKKVCFIKCKSMKTFSAFNKIDHSIKSYSPRDAKPRRENDLNAAVRNKFEEEALLDHSSYSSPSSHSDEERYI